MSSQANRVIKRAQQACTSCRQVKLRCDGRETFPQACSRCMKNNLECRTDSTFKRVRTRHRLDEVTSQLNAIQKTLGTHVANLGAGVQIANSTPSTTADGSLSSPKPISSGRQNDDLEYHTEEVEKLGFYRPSLLASPISIGSVSIDNDQIKELFEHFEDHYYRHCPILDTNTSITELYRTSPFLFWTIIVISCQWHPSLSYIYGLIVDEYRLMIGSVFVGPIFQLHLIQGIVLLCFWPLSVTKQIYDPTWNYCGLITNAALKMALQNVTKEKDAVLDKSLAGAQESHAKTWMACVQVNAIYAWSYGLSMSMEITRGVTFSSNSSSAFDLEFEAKTVLHQQSAKYALMMATISTITDSLQLIQSLIQDLENVKGRYREVWNNDMDIILLSIQLKIYAFQLQAQSQRRKDPLIPTKDLEVDISSKALQNLGFPIAVRIIHIFSELFDMSGTASNTSSYSQVGDAGIFYRYLPKGFSQSLLFAASFIFKLMAVRDPELPSSDIDLARNHIRTTYRILSSQSRVASDEPGRAARMIEVLSRAHDLSRLKQSELRPGLGSGLHLLEDTIRIAKEIREGIPEASKSFQSDNKTTGAKLDIAGPGDDTIPPQHPEIPDLCDLSQPEYPFDYEQLFDWNTIDWNNIGGLDLSVSHFSDVDVENSI